MSKELEKDFMNDITSEFQLEVEPRDIFTILYDIYDVPSPICEQVKPMIERLEIINNSNSNEALKILETLADDGLLNKEIGAISYNQIWLKNQIEVVKQALFKAQENENALKIIFEKNVDILELRIFIEHYVDKIALNLYNSKVRKDWQLTEEEFGTLKRYTNER